MIKSSEIRIENSTCCNFECSFCPHSTDFERPKQIMTFELFKLIIDKAHKEVPRIINLTLSGLGETFLDKTILNKIEYAKQLNYDIHILTNGSLLTYSIIDELLNFDCELRFSLHYDNDLTFTTITKANKSFYTKIISNLHYATLHSKKNIIITYDVTKDNPNFQSIINQYSKTNTLEIWKPHNWTNWNDFRTSPQTKQTCGRPFNGPLQIQIDGTINMCCFDYNGQLLLGDFKTQSLKQIFKSPEYMEIYSHHKKNTIQTSNLLCKNCDQLQDSKDIIIYNNRNLSIEDRVNRTSTNLQRMNT